MRITKARTAINNIFEKNHKPLSAPELLILLTKQNVNVNKTTVYRELDFLKKGNLIREVVWDDSVMRYETSDPNCHHHVVCKHCGKVSPVHINEDLLLASVEKQSHYKLDKHIIEFFGLCSECK